MANSIPWAEAPDWIKKTKWAEGKPSLLASWLCFDVTRGLTPPLPTQKTASSQVASVPAKRNGMSMQSLPRTLHEDGNYVLSFYWFLHNQYSLQYFHNNDYIFRRKILQLTTYSRVGLLCAERWVGTRDYEIKVSTRCPVRATSQSVSTSMGPSLVWCLSSGTRTPARHATRSYANNLQLS